LTLPTSLKFKVYANLCFHGVNFYNLVYNPLCITYISISIEQQSYTMRFHIFIHFLNYNKFLPFHISFHMQPSWNIQTICSMVFKGQAPKLFFKQHLLTTKMLTIIPYRGNITLNSHFKQTFQTIIFFSILDTNVQMDVPFASYSKNYIVSFSHQLPHQQLVCGFHDVIWEIVLTSTHLELFKPMTTSKWSLLLKHYLNNIKCSISHDLHQVNHQ
jgi:hypothetical protein